MLKDSMKEQINKEKKRRDKNAFIYNWITIFFTKFLHEHFLLKYRQIHIKNFKEFEKKNILLLNIKRPI